MQPIGEVIPPLTKQSRTPTTSKGWIREVREMKERLDKMDRECYRKFLLESMIKQAEIERKRLNGVG